MNRHSILRYLSIGIEEILAGISDGIFILNEKGKFVFVNKVIEERSSIPFERFRTLHYLDLIPPEYQQHAQEYFNAILKGENPPAQEFDYYTARGEIRSIEIRGRRIITAGGIPLVFITARNITERKAAERTRMAALQEKAALFGAISDGIIVFNARGIITDINLAFEKMAGITRDQIVGKHGSEIAKQIVPPPYTDHVLENFTRALSGEIIPPMKIAFTDFRRREIPVFFTTSFLRDEKGMLCSIISVLKDISDIVKTEESLRQSEQRYRSIADNLMLGLFVCERATGKFIYVNKSVEKIFGYTPEETLNLKIWDVIHPDEHSIITERVEKRLRGEIAPEATFVYTGIRKDGVHIKVEISSSAFTLNGKPIVQGVFRDVTEIESLQSQLLHAQKMKAIGTLAGGIAHDFNNLLMGIQGNASLLLMDIPKESTLRELVRNIQELVTQGASLTRQLLGFARGGKYEIKPENINSIITEGTSIFQRTHKEIVIVLNLRKDLPSVEVERRQIDQVLLNMLLNAYEAMPHGGTITIKTDTYYISDVCAVTGIALGTYIQISITDTGIGMDETTKQRIFDPFFTTKDMSRGIGMGLTSAYGIIKAHGGFIEVESAPGKGSTFKIFLPASDKRIETQVVNINEPLQGRGTVLIIDDETPVLTVTAKLVESLGYTAKTAQSGNEALDIFQASHGVVDCIILDLIMPNTNTSELLSRLRTLRPNIPVILASGYSLEGQAKKILAMDGVAFLQKPFTLEDLSKKLHLALNKTREWQ